jgi:hypothetical protein
MTGAARESRATAGPLRQALILLTALSAMGIAIELVMARHWESGTQLVAWLPLVLLLVGVVLLLRQPGARSVQVVRALAGVVALTALYGVYQHVHANYLAGPLDYRFADRWAVMSLAARWWAASTQTVGVSPPLVPGVLAQSALCLLFATIRHPGLAAPGNARHPGRAPRELRTADP